MAVRKLKKKIKKYIGRKRRASSGSRHSTRSRSRVDSPTDRTSPTPGPSVNLSPPSQAPRSSSAPPETGRIDVDDNLRQSAGSPRSNTPTTDDITPGPDPSTTISPPSPPHRASSAPPKIRSIVTSGARESFVAFLGVVNKSARVFGPLTEVLEVFVSCVDITQASIAGQPEYEAVKAQLADLFTDLINYFPEASPPAMTASMRSLCGAIRGEIEIISERQRENGSGRRLEATQDLHDVLDCYRRIHGHLERLKMNVDLSIWKTLDEHVTETRLKGISPVLSARYNSAQASLIGRRECTPDTREQVLLDLKTWRNDINSEKIFYLNGMAGTGKTTISSTLCASLDQEHALGASFFCSRQLPECRNVNSIFPSIAYQLARFSRPFRIALSQVLENDPDAHTQTLRAQFDLLILGPLREVADTLPANVVVVIDALDECEDAEGVGQILQVLLKHTSELPIKFFVSSRPEPQIRRWIGGMESQLILHELDKNVVKRDIEIYLRAELESVSLSEEQLASLVERAGTLFIYAATVVRYLGAGDSSILSEERLDDILGVQSEASSSQYKEVDALYGAILGSAFHKSSLGPREKDRMRLVLDTVVCVREPLTVHALAGLFNLKDTKGVQAALEPLWSVLHVSDNGLVSTLHASFPDYMLDSARSTAYGCKAQVHHRKLAMLCFDRMKRNEQQFNICGLKSSYVFDDQVPDLAERVERSIPLDLSYACQYWAVHLEMGLFWNEGLKPLLEFLSERVLLWMEVLNLKQLIGDGVVSMDKAKRWCIDAGCPAEIKSLVHDAWRFIMMFAANSVSRSTPHLYISMLASWPQEEPMSQCYLKRTRGLVGVKGGKLARRDIALLGTFGAGGEITSVAFSPDGAQIVSGSRDKTIRVWDGQTGKMLLDPLQGHSSSVSSVALSPNGTRIISGSYDKTIRVWDRQTGKMLLDPLQGHTGPVSSVAFSPDNSRIVSGSQDFTIRLWDGWTGKLLLKPDQHHHDLVLSVVFSPDGTRIASGSIDKTIRVWDGWTGKMPFGPLQGHTSRVSSVTFSPDGTRILSGSHDCTIRLWDGQSGKMILDPLRGHTDSVLSVAFSPDGTHIVSGSHDCTIRIWDGQTGTALLDPLRGHIEPVSSVAFSPDGTRIVSGSYDSTIRLWDGQPNKTMPGPLQGHANLVSSVTFSPDGTRIVSGSMDKTVRVWDGQTGIMVLEPLHGHTKPVTSVAISSDGTRIVSGSEDKTICIWDGLTGKMVLDPLQGHSHWVSSVAFSSNGSQIVSGSHDNTLRVWDGQTGKLTLDPLQGHTDNVLSVVFSPDGRRIISGSSDETIRVWNVQTGHTLLDPFRGHTDWVESVAFSPDGTRIVSGSRDNTIRVWDGQSGQTVLGPLLGHTNPVSSVAFSPNGSCIVSGSWDKTIRVWDGKTGKELLVPLEGHTNFIWSVAFSPDGTRIVSGSYDRTIRVWDARGPHAVLHSTQGHLESSPTTSFSWVLTSNPTLHAPSWVLNRDGWVVDGQSCLLWVPHDLRDTLLRYSNSLVVSSGGSAELDFSNTNIGESWAQCYSLA